jgi:hypothetical protein
MDMNMVIKTLKRVFECFVLMATINFLKKMAYHMSIEDHGWMELCPSIFFLG